MTNSGKLISRVLLDATTVNMQDDMSVWESAGDFTHWAMTVAHLLPGEFPESLYNVNKVSFYAAQVDNGGHRQFAQNSGWQPDTVERRRSWTERDQCDKILGRLCEVPPFDGL